MANELQFNVSDLLNVRVYGIDTSDYPEFTEAYISSAGIMSTDDEYRDISKEELLIVNTLYPEYVNECVFDNLHAD